MKLISRLVVLHMKTDKWACQGLSIKAKTKPRKLEDHAIAKVQEDIGTMQSVWKKSKSEKCKSIL